MEQKIALYGECLKVHAHMGWKVDGCQEFKACTKPGDVVTCSICNCHVNYHKRVVPQARVTHVTEVVYTECHKNHNNINGSQVSKDGCREFRERKRQRYGDACCMINRCDACGCDMFMQS